MPGLMIDLISLTADSNKKKRFQLGKRITLENGKIYRQCYSPIAMGKKDYLCMNDLETPYQKRIRGLRLLR